MPFTSDQFFHVFEKYNQSVFPIQFVLIFAAVAIVALVVSEKPFANRTVSALLGFLWLWTGAVYHLIFFTEINPAAYLFGAAFVFQGLLFIYEGATNRLVFRVERNLEGVIGAMFIVYALVIYPLVGYGLGRTFPAAPTFGAPCPTVIFTLGLLLWGNLKISWWLLIVPILWSLVAT